MDGAPTSEKEHNWKRGGVEVKTEGEGSRASLIPWQSEGAKYTCAQCPIYLPPPTGLTDQLRVSLGIEYMFQCVKT